MQTVVLNWDRIGGARGLFVPIKRPDSLLNFQFHESKAVYYYIAGLLALTLGTTRWIERSRRGHLLPRDSGGPGCGGEPRRAGRPREARGDGRLGGLTALGGTFWAQYVLFIDPESVFPLSLSILICLVAVLERVFFARRRGDPGPAVGGNPCCSAGPARRSTSSSTARSSC